jgi:hypothetical protein
MTPARRRARAGWASMRCAGRAAEHAWRRCAAMRGGAAPHARGAGGCSGIMRPSVVAGAQLSVNACLHPARCIRASAGCRHKLTER